MKQPLVYLTTLMLTVICKSTAVTPPLTGYKHVINVTSSGEKECTNLSEALKKAFTYNTSVLLRLSDGCFNLSSNELATFTGWTDFAIAGTGMDTSKIKCSVGVGLMFVKSFGILFRNLTLVGCGRKQISTSKSMTSTSDRISFLDMWVGVYFLSCGNVTMDYVQVRESQGVGVVMYNCNGTNTFNYTKFVVNFMDSDSPYHERSGGMAVEFTFCQPRDTNCKDSEASSVQVSQSEYTFFQCLFDANGDQSSDVYNGRVIRYPHGTEHVAFGKGGGLSIIFKGRSSGNSIMIDSCKFSANSAQWGGGLYTSFMDQSIDNKVTVARSQFYFNVNFCMGNSPKWMKSGGGAQIDFIYYPADNDLWPGYQPKVVGNDVSFYDTYFASNGACWGGAVSVIVSRESPGNSASNSISFDNCIFSYNQASIAAAVDVSIFQPDLITSDGTLMKPLFKNCRFNQNGISYSNAMNRQLATGSLYANQVPLNFTGKITFSSNDGTALAVSGTYVTLSESSELTFDSNVGRHGGALAFIGNSWLVVHRNSHVLFSNNSADTLGGAVYSVHFGEHDLMYKWNCFFQYYKAAQTPSEWNATIKFTGNSVKGIPNSIYTTSLLPCVWPSGGFAFPLMNGTFCSPPFTFDTHTSCVDEISTGPSDLNVTELSIEVVPGWGTKIPVTAKNDFGDDIFSVFTVTPYEEKDKIMIAVSNSTEYIADNKVTVYGVVNNTARLLLRTLDPRVISSQLEVNIRDCPPGYSRVYCDDNPEMVCNCICKNAFLGVGCNNDTHLITVYRYNCLTPWYERNRPTLVSGRCPYNRGNKVFETLSFNESSQKKMCEQLNRTGTLCSKCKPGTGVDVNSYNFPCVKCDRRYSWLLYILVELLPIVIFFVILAFFNGSATSAPMNAFVFFSQIITIPYFHNPYTFVYGILQQTHYKILDAFISLPYSIWNLDFFVTSLIPGFCLDHRLTTLYVILLKYINALLPLLLIIVCYVLIELHDRNYRSIRCLWLPFQNCLKRIYKDRNPKKSIIDVFATCLLLSYCKIIYVTFSLLSPSILHVDATGDTNSTIVFYFDASKEMFSGKFAIICTCAIVIFGLFVLLPPAILLLYPFGCFQRIIDKLPFKIALRTFAEAFNGDFRDGLFKDGSRGDSDCRRFAGYYFLFRVVVFILFLCELTWLEQYFIQQVLLTVCVAIFAGVRPYKVAVYNKLDTSVFLLLSFLNACSFYNSQLYIAKDHISQAVFWINYLLIFLPLVYFIGYVVYLILLWKGCLKRFAKISSVSESIVVTNEPSSLVDSENGDGYTYAFASRESEDDIPDRLVNPQNYNSRNLYKPQDESTASLLQQRPRQGSSDKSYFHVKRNRNSASYGSFTTMERHTEPIIRYSARDKSSESSKSKSTNTSGVRFDGVV